MERKRLNAWVEVELYEQALAKAKSEDLSLSQVIRRLLRQYVGSSHITVTNIQEVETEEDED